MKGKISQNKRSVVGSGVERSVNHCFREPSKTAAGDDMSDHARENRGNSNSRPNILLLGMSYPCIRSHMEFEGYSAQLMQQVLHDEPWSDLERAVELVRRNILTEMDGRDWARIRATEDLCHAQAHAVSQEMAAQYHPQRHLHANFNRTDSFLRGLQKQFGRHVKFRQIILDYFWIPQGTWVMTHWSRSFFQITLPRLVPFLEFPPLHSTSTSTDGQEQENDGYGVIYLPFCYHCMKELVASMKVLEKYFSISFVYQSQLAEHSLWAGTQTIDEETMQQWLGKRRAQEDIYCTFTPRDVHECMEDPTVTKDDVIKVLRGIEDFSSVRMIKLQPLPHQHPGLAPATPPSPSNCVTNHKRQRRWPLRRQPLRRENRIVNKPPKQKQVTPKGGFVGLQVPENVKNGFDSLKQLTSKEAEESSICELQTEPSDSSSEADGERGVSNPKSCKTDRRSPVSGQGGRTTTAKRPRLFRPAADLDTYAKLGEEGHEQTSSHYEIDEKDHFSCTAAVSVSDSDRNGVACSAENNMSLDSRLALDFIETLDERAAREFGAIQSPKSPLDVTASPQKVSTVDDMSESVSRTHVVKPGSRIVPGSFLILESPMSSNSDVVSQQSKVNSSLNLSVSETDGASHAQPVMQGSPMFVGSSPANPVAICPQKDEREKIFSAVQELALTREVQQVDFETTIMSDNISIASFAAIDVEKHQEELRYTIHGSQQNTSDQDFVCSSQERKLRQGAPCVAETCNDTLVTMTASPQNGRSVFSTANTLAIPNSSADLSDIMYSYLELLMQQMERCPCGDLDFTSQHQGKRLAPPGFVCRHCVGRRGDGIYFPKDESWISYSSFFTQFQKHLNSCQECPPQIKAKLGTLRKRQHHHYVARWSTQQCPGSEKVRQLFRSLTIPGETGPRPPHKQARAYGNGRELLDLVRFSGGQSPLTPRTLSLADTLLAVGNSEGRAHRRRCEGGAETLPLTKCSELAHVAPGSNTQERHKGLKHHGQLRADCASELFVFTPVPLSNEYHHPAKKDKIGRRCSPDGIDMV